MLHATSDSIFFGITHQAPALALQSHKLGSGLLEEEGIQPIQSKQSGQYELGRRAWQQQLQRVLSASQDAQPCNEPEAGGAMTHRLLLGLGGAQAVEELGSGHALLLEAAEEAAVQCSLNRGRGHAQLSCLLYCPLACSMHSSLHHPMHNRQVKAVWISKNRTHRGCIALSDQMLELCRLPS